MEILNELYLGRGPVEPLRQQVTVIREKFRGKHVNAGTNMDPDILKFNRLAEKIFGFHRFSLYIQADNVPNAYTFPIDVYFTEEDKANIIKSLTASPTGFKYSNAFPGVSMIMAVNSGLIDLDIVTDDEIMATILHEIGHGFFQAVINPDNAYTTSRKMMSMLTTLNKCAMDKIKRGKEATAEAISRDVDMFTSSIKGMVKSIRKMAHHSIHESMADNVKRNRVEYTNEKFADTFAAMYGYAEPCNSVDVKINAATRSMAGAKSKNRPKFIETMLMYKKYAFDLVEYILNIQDEHPENLARMKTLTEYLKHELAKEGIDPMMKREMVAELNKIYELIDAYRNYPKDGDSIRILRLYHSKLYEKFGGDRREKDTDNKALFDFIDSRYNALAGKSIEECFVDVPDDPIIEASNYSETDYFLDVLCANADCYNESAISDIKDRIINVKDLWDQWKKSTKSFINHKWIYRYVNEKQKAQLEKHYEALKDPDVYYSTYKRSFNAICKFVGLPTDTIILEDVVFKKDSVDKDQDIIAVRYSKGKVRVQIPDGIRLIHTHVTSDNIDIKELRPSFRSKTVGKYMYPSRRCFFTCVKAIANSKAGMTGAVNKYTPKDPIKFAYIDPTYPDFNSNAVYVETETPIPVEDFKSAMDKMVDNVKEKIGLNKSSKKEDQ